MVKLIASDLDGTLLQNGAQELTPRSIRLIHELTQKGIIFIAASGRQYDSERRMFAPIRDEISYIAENGSLCVHRGDVLFRGILEDDLAFRIIREIKKEKNFEIAVSREDACLIEGHDSAFVDHILNVIKNTTKVVDDLTKIDGPILKIAVANMVDGPEAITAYLRHLQNMFGSEIRVVTSGNIWIDFILPGANKGTALGKFLELFQVAPEECIVFGDQYNDLEMLDLAGTSYGMSNAAPGVLRHCTHVTDSVDDVLEEILRGISGSPL